MTYAKKSFGQHFLHDPSVIEKIITAANPAEYAVTVEVGPGRGALTECLAPLARRLVLLEADRDLALALQERFANAELHVGDAAKADYARIVPEREWMLVGNLPYNAANAILMHALTASHPPAHTVVMVQKEVGERMLTMPHAMSVLGVAVALYAKVERVCVVKPGAFNPPPKVDSMVLKLTRRIWEGEDYREAIIALAKAGFANRRKVLVKNLAAVKGVVPALVTGWLCGHGYTATARAEELRPDDWIALYRFLRQEGEL